MGTTFNRQVWPARATVTAGMPYGNKPLHFGHIAGVFVPADCYARFLRDRIGSENVRFVCGTDCFGSPIDEGYRKAAEGGFTGSITDYVQANHDVQKAALDAFDISLDIFEGSGIGEAGRVHQDLTYAFIERLYQNGWLALRSTKQFFDPEAQVFLNGRQVVGRCPVQGCKSEHGYADECDLGHSYAPEELIAPRSTVSGSVPTMKPVDNWYFDLPAFRQDLIAYVDAQANDPDVRPIVAQTCREFLMPPIIYVKCDDREAFDSIADKLPAHALREAEKGKSSFEVEFKTIDDRDRARDILHGAGVRFRTGKALVPFRITGNIDWGVKAPVLEGVEGLTVWCWPESLWAPISFTKAVNEARGLPEDSWKDFWCSPDAQVYQFIGQDNLYFYGIAQPALFSALLPGGIFSHAPVDDPLRQTRLIANYHVLFGNKKASSSSDVKPPTAEEMLEYYTVAQLRAHFLALGLGQKSVGFKPKAFEAPEVRDDPRVADPALKESKLLSNVFNRLARSVLYEAKKNFACTVPLDAPSPHVVEQAHRTLSEYDRIMKKAELHSIMALMDEFIRFANKTWADGISAVEKGAEEVTAPLSGAHCVGNGADTGQTAAPDARRQVLADAAYLLWVCTLLMHPIVPAGCEDICEKLRFDPARFFSWEHPFDSLAELGCGEAAHKVAELEPRYDFF